MNLLPHFQGELLTKASEISEKLKNIRAIVSDWDGVFNTGEKNPSVPSSFYEADSMGTNLLRYSFWKRDKTLPHFAIITGADNPTARYLANREHFTALYGRIIDKAESLKHFCEHCEIEPEQVAIFFDDANDLSMAKLAGLRFMVCRSGNSLFAKYLKKENLVDYITHAAGGEYAIREISEMCIYMMGSYEEVLEGRMNFSEDYQRFFEQRQVVSPLLFSREEEGFKVMNLRNE